MKLLNLQEQNNLKEDFQKREVLRIQATQEASNQVKKDLAKAQVDFNVTMAYFNEKWAITEKEHSERVQEMKIEIEKLEDRKKKALVPIKVYKKTVDKMFNDAEELNENLKLKEKDIEDTQDLLEDKLDEVASKEQILRTKEIKLGLREQGIKEQEEIAKRNIDKINKSISEFTNERLVRLKEIEDRKMEVLIKESNIDARIESLNRTEKSLSEWAIRLKDERDTLDREYKRRGSN